MTLRRNLILITLALLVIAATIPASSFGGYAVTGIPVPEPASLALLALGGILLLRRH